MTDTPFEQCVFLNCPFDREYDPILQSLLFVIVYIGLTPRLARERSDSGDIRLDKITSLIEASKFSIHDLSRCQAGKKGEHYRLNMPFELGLDYGCRLYRAGGRDQKRILILEEEHFRYQAAISDLAACDIEAHDGKFDVAMRKVRNWFASQRPGTKIDGASKIVGAYYDFQEWYLDKQKLAGFSESDISDYSTPELLAAMVAWNRSERPTR